MKNLLLFFFCFLFTANLSFAQTASSSRAIVVKGTSASLDLVAQKTQVAVEAIDALLIINRLNNNAIEEIEVITGAYDAKYRPVVKRLRPRPGSGVIAHFRVEGHPKGPYSVILTPARVVNPRKGRQQNRRVEIKIVFN